MKLFALFNTLLLIFFSGSFLVAQNHSASSTYDGYTLYSKMGNTHTYLLNMDKTIYHTWTTTVGTGYSTYMLPSGHLIRTGQYSGNVLTGGAMCGMVQDIDWNGNLVWQYIYSTANYCTHHDIHPMPNGNVLLISYEVKSATEVTAAGCSQSIIMWPDKIIEVQPSGTSGGTIVWEWHAWDHLCQNYNSAKNNYVTSISQHPELININYNTQKDWMHTNGIDYNAELDQIIISSHNLNEVYVIDHSTTTAQAAGHTGGNSGKGGDILYRWGNPLAYGCGTSANQVFKVVHDAHWVPYGCPHAADLVGFNNQGATGSHSCVDRWTPPYNGYNYSVTLGSAFTPSTYAWRHTCLGDAQDQSNSQQLPNGNTLVCIASTGYIYELDANQNLLWNYTAGGTVAMAFRYTSCYLNGNLTVSASAASTSICSGSSAQLTATTTSGTATSYSWTSSPSGFTSTLQNPVVTPTANTKYYVTALNGTCSSLDSVSISVNGPISVTASAGSPTSCYGISTQLNAVPSGGTSYTYSWTSVPSGFTSTLQNPIVTPLVTTTYTVAVSSGGCTATGSTTVTVTGPITVSSAATPSSINLGQSAQLNASASGGSGYTYSWTSNPAGFTSTLQNPVVTPTVTTVYSVTAHSSVCEANSTVTVTQSGATPALSVLPATQTVSGAAGNASFTVTSNSIWTATSDQSWCTVTATGTGNGSIQATFSQNLVSTSRTANITIAVNALSPVVVTLVQDGVANKTLNLTLLLEGLYNGTSLNKAQGTSGPQYQGVVADLVTVELRNPDAGFSLAGGPYQVNVNTDGTSTIALSASLTSSYYIVLKHRNSIETWSSLPVSCSSTATSYNFTDAAGKAYGNNLKAASGKYLIYTGDVNQDGMIDCADMIPVDNDAVNALAGYIATDANGDGMITNADIELIDANAQLFISKKSPE